MNYLDWISKWSSYKPDKKAVMSLDTGLSLTYKQLDEKSRKVGSYLLNHFQLKKGDRIAVVAAHSPEYLMLFIAAQRLGLILVPLNFRATEYELMHYIKDVNPTLILAEPKQFNVLNTVFKKRNTPSLIQFDSFFTEADKLELDPENINFSIEVDQPIFIFYTSGTTGKPKGVIYTNRMMFWNSLNTSMQLELTSLDHTLNVLPPFHTSGWNVLLLPMLHRGARVDFLKRFKPKKVLNYLESEPISLFLAVPTMLRMMAKNKAFSDFTPNKLKYIVVGGEPLSIPLIDAWAEKGILLSQGYGLTEAGPCITSLHYHDAIWKKGSIGKPNFYVDIKIVNSENEEVAIHEAGEICLKGNIVTPGYWNNSGYSLNKIREEWLYTGDMAKFDEDGFMYVLGRKNQLYISGGENIHPSEIEHILYKYDLVREAAVVGIENENWGEIGVAFIVLKNENLDVTDILNHLKKYLAAYKVPKDIICLDSLPKSGIGKIDRVKLKSLYKILDHDKKNVV